MQRRRLSVGTRGLPAIAFVRGASRGPRSQWRRSRRQASSRLACALPRKGTPAPVDPDDRFDDSRHLRRTLASNGKQTSVMWAGCTRRPPRVGARVLSARALVSRSLSVRPNQLSRSPNLKRPAAAVRTTAFIFPTASRRAIALATNRILGRAEFFVCLDDRIRQASALATCRRPTGTRRSRAQGQRGSPPACEGCRPAFRGSWPSLSGSGSARRPFRHAHADCFAR
jgi:hypothetical protein